MTRLALSGQGGNDQTDEERDRDHDQREDHGQMIRKVLATDRDNRVMPGAALRDIIAKMRHGGCGGRAARAEPITGIEGAISRPARGAGDQFSRRSALIRVAA